MDLAPVSPAAPQGETASSICGQNFHLCYTWWRGPFWCFAMKSSTHYNFHIQSAIYSKLLKRVEGLAQNTSTQHAPMRVDCKGPFIAACSFNCILILWNLDQGSSEKPKSRSGSSIAKLFQHYPNAAVCISTSFEKNVVIPLDWCVYVCF